MLGDHDYLRDEGMTTNVKVAGLMDEQGNRVNTILVHVDEAGKVVDYTPPNGVTLVIDADAPVDIVDPDNVPVIDTAQSNNHFDDE